MTDIAKGSLTAAHADEFVTAWADADELTWEECRAIGVEDEVCADVQSVLLVAGCVTVSERERLIGRGYPENFVSSLFGHDGWRAAEAKAANLRGFIESCSTGWATARAGTGPPSRSAGIICLPTRPPGVSSPPLSIRS